MHEAHSGATPSSLAWAPCGKSPQLYYLCASLLISDLIHIQPAMTRPPGLRGLRGSSSGGGGGGGGSIGTRRRDGQASGFGLFTVCSSRALWGREATVLACLFCTDVKLHFFLPGDGELLEKERLHSFAWLSQGRLKNREGSGISSEAMKVDYRVDVDIKHLKKL